MGQEAVYYWTPAYLSLGKTIVGPKWPSSGLSDAQLIAIGQANYASYYSSRVVPPNNAPQIRFNEQPAPASSGGIAIPNSSCIFKNPS